jgi:zinc transporter ZupT
MLAMTLHNFPEGLAIALPLRRGGMTRGRAFFRGQLSAAIEPIVGGGSTAPIGYRRFTQFAVAAEDVIGGSAPSREGAPPNVIVGSTDTAADTELPMKH